MPIKDMIMGAKDLVSDTVTKLLDANAQTEDRIKMPQKEIDDYRNKITNAERFAKKQFIDAYAKRYLGYLNGEMNGRTFAPDDNKYDSTKMYKIFCNEFYVNSETLKPNLYFKNPYVSFEAKQDEVEVEIMQPVPVPAMNDDGSLMLDATGRTMMTTEERPQKVIRDAGEIAELLEPVVNDMLQSPNVKWKKVAKKCVATMIPLNFAVSKWGWDTQTRGEAENLQLLTDEPICEWFNPLNFLPDPECTSIDLTDAKYIVFRYVKPTALIKANPQYKGVKKLTGSSELRFVPDPDDAGTNLTKDYVGDLTDIERNTLYEVHDIINRKMVVFVDALDYPIRDTSEEEWAKEQGDGWMWGLKGYCCKILAAGESLTGFYPTPDFRAYESLVITKTKLVQKLTNLMLLINRSFLYDSTAIKDKNKMQQICDVGEAGAVGVDNPHGKNLNDFIKLLNDFSYNDSYNQFLRVIDVNLERLSGISDFQRGLMSQAKRTASEILNLQAGQNLRVDFKMDAVVDFMEENVQLLLELLQHNADKPRVQKVMRDNKAIWPVWDKNEIQGQYALSINVGDMQKQNVEAKKQDDMAQYNMFMKNDLVNKVEETTRTMRALGEKTPDKRLNAGAVYAYQLQSQMQAAGMMPAKTDPNEPAPKVPEPKPAGDGKGVPGVVTPPGVELETAKKGEV